MTDAKMMELADTIADVISRGMLFGDLPNMRKAEAALRPDVRSAASPASPPLPTTNAGGEALQEKIARTLYECEKRRAEHCQSVLQRASGKECPGAAMEPWEECSEVFLSDASAVIAALATTNTTQAEVREQTIEECADIALAIDSGRGNEKEIAKAIRRLAIHPQRPRNDSDVCPYCDANMGGTNCPSCGRERVADAIHPQRPDAGGECRHGLSEDCPGCAEETIAALVKALEDIDRHLDNFGYPATMKARRLAREALNAPAAGRQAP
jgi:uncharacterized protein (UPF0212 family)